MEWSTIIATIALVLSAIIAAASSAWIVSGSTRKLASKKDLSEIDDRLTSEFDNFRNDLGEGLAALRQKLVEVELWNRDNFVRLYDFKALQDELKKIDGRLDHVASMEVKIDTIWSFQMRRAMSEVVTAGVGSKNSPLHFTDEARRLFAPIADELALFYQAMTAEVKLNDATVLLELEHRFGERLLDMVCIPCGLSHGACLLLAYSIAKQTNDLEIHLP